MGNSSIYRDYGESIQQACSFVLSLCLNTFIAFTYYPCVTLIHRSYIAFIHHTSVVSLLYIYVCTCTSTSNIFCGSLPFPSLCHTFRHVMSPGRGVYSLQKDFVVWLYCVICTCIILVRWLTSRAYSILFSNGGNDDLMLTKSCPASQYHAVHVHTCCLTCIGLPCTPCVNGSNYLSRSFLSRSPGMIAVTCGSRYPSRGGKSTGGVSQ